MVNLCLASLWIMWKSCGEGFGVIGPAKFLNRYKRSSVLLTSCSCAACCCYQIFETLRRFVRASVIMTLNRLYNYILLRTPIRV